MINCCLSQKHLFRNRGWFYKKFLILPSQLSNVKIVTSLEILHIKWASIFMVAEELAAEVIETSAFAASP